MTESKDFALSCPRPIDAHAQVQMAHGGGGRLSHQLVETVFLPAFRNSALEARHDGAVLDPPNGRLAFTTDSHVVSPLFFPGGDIGTLAVNGTVNDLAMCGARPRYLSAGFVLEEGLPQETLERLARSMGSAAAEAGVTIVTGDTKVVDRGKGDGVFITTAGVGVLEHSLEIGPAHIRPGDALLLSGDIGRHGLAIMAVREGLEFESALESDCACVAAPVLAMLEAGLELHCLRDLTRGGLASALVEISTASGQGIHIEEVSIPVEESVQGACEILGFDPLYVANEGRFVCFLPENQLEEALRIMRAFPVASSACAIGHVGTADEARVTLTSRIGVRRVVDMLSGEQLPRIC